MAYFYKYVTISDGKKEDSGTNNKEDESAALIPEGKHPKNYADETECDKDVPSGSEDDNHESEF